MICKKCGASSETIDSESEVCPNCIDKDFFEWLDKKEPKE